MARKIRQTGLSSLLPFVVVCLAAVFGAGYVVGHGGMPTGWTGGTPGVSAKLSGDNVQCYFSPRGGCTDAIVAQINGAKTSVHVQAYSFTSKPIAAALVGAAKRGVKVEAVLDKSQRSEKYSEADFLAHAGIPTWIDSKHAIAHNKIMLIDGTTILTGSFNFTNAAEKNNAENLLVLKDVPELYAAYEANFQAHLAHSDRY